MAEAAARPEAGEKLVFLEDRLNEEEGKDFPRAIPKEAKREKDRSLKSEIKYFRERRYFYQK